MELRLVYRILRKVSDWALSNFYSEVYVDLGEQNVPKETPLIMTPCHHNELIDVATLAATIPYRRKVSFWAKSTTFAHPVLGPILSSSGAIPVRRNPDKADSASSNAALFDATTRALAQIRSVIGVFPEGTSYTEPAIAQILSGAAWAALEFMRSRHAGGKTGSVVIIPVGIVYTDKSKFRSRVSKAYLRYGLPIDMASYVSSSVFNSPDPEAERAVVKTVMKDVEAQLLKMTINAPDWETMYAAQMTRDILWEEERNVKLKDWVVVSQTLVKLFSPSEDPELVSVKRALTKYFALLHYTNITHAELEQLIKGYDTTPSLSFIFRFIFIAFRTLLNPSFLLFIPPFIAHIPAYLFAGLGSKYLAPAGEEESQQFKVILGGIGAGLGAGMGSYWITRLAKVFDINSGMRNKLFVWTLTAWILSKWHWALVERLSAALKMLFGVLQPRSWDLSSSQVASYEIPPAPAANPFSSRRRVNSPWGESMVESSTTHRAFQKDHIPLVIARRIAVSALATHLQHTQFDAEKRILSDLGGRINFNAQS
ncbi:glycerol-3-phosphate O-acyltransferase [Mycena polygramma]|nr:glycerol-3-phosphate O-acyltransferase [Mycena polygramma]